ncbi:hypothetical protein CEUSTIGMA_g8820.t1 [Chlamydomonas eustigma]|uniref:Major facilitator superfamily (MFS) profile domain-containing protein n=1 Tax=Chlamydomonas eustigma TaxID=1157962 RepID=A0A250XEN7_9CHLO|nr:hypothetical protein CEUSTIGMA_g8820.t1 [Chlamydomonas eustigma]|eukprot:GAX81389.1 hypothetical protein CEUSTIGMA_g8820.t1 [Chlamydomonas eustigma]
MVSIPHCHLILMNATNQILLLSTIYGLVSLIFGVQLSIVGPMASVLAKQAGCTEAEIAPVLGMSGIGLIVGGIPSGWIMDHAPGHLVLGVSCIIQAVGFAVMPFCRSVLELAVVYGAISLTFNMINTGVNCLSMWLLPCDQPGLPITIGFLLNALSMLFGVGALLAPQLVHFVEVHTGSGTGVYYIATALAGVAAITLLMLPPGPASPNGQTGPKLSGSLKKAEQASEGSEALAPFQPIIWDEEEVRDHGNPGLLHSSTAGKEADSRKKDSVFWRMCFQAGLLMLIFANVSIELGYGNWIYTYSIKQAGLSEAAGQQITSLYWLIFTLGRLPAMFMATCLSTASIMALMMPLAVLGSVLPLVMGSAPAASTGGDASLAFSNLGSRTPFAGGLHLLVSGSSGALALNTSRHSSLTSIGSQYGSSVDAGGGLTSVITATILVAAGAAAGVPCSMSMATEYVEVDGFLNGAMSTVAGLGATFFPFAVPMLAKWLPNLGFQCLMLATFAMALLQIASLFAMILTGRILKSQRGKVLLYPESQNSLEDTVALGEPLLTSHAEDVHG